MTNKFFRQILLVAFFGCICLISIPTTAKAECPNDGNPWIEGSESVRYYTSNCFILYKFCYYFDDNSSLHLIVKEMSTFQNHSCFDSLDLLYDYQWYLDMCVADLFNKLVLLVDFDEFQNGSTNRFLVPPCEWDKNLIVIVGHPNCVSEPYSQEIITSQVDGDGISPNDPPIFAIDGEWGAPPTSYIPDEPLIDADGIETQSPIKEGNQLQDQANGRVWIKCISPCGSIVEGDICWENKYYCWYLDENGKQKLREDSYVVPTSFGSTCPGETTVYTTKNIDMNKYFNPVSVPCNFICDQTNR
jgi:hypothetical protein